MLCSECTAIALNLRAWQDPLTYICTHVFCQVVPLACFQQPLNPEALNAKPKGPDPKLLGPSHGPLKGAPTCFLQPIRMGPSLGLLVCRVA